jgi:hypothetical protein
VIKDQNEYDIGILKGMNVHVHSGSGSFAWPQGDYDAMAAAGMKIARHVIHWDVFETSAGSIDSVALTDLDNAIARAKNAGIYTVLDLPHLNVNRTPAWAQTGSPANEVGWFGNNGQNLVQTLANRYASEKAVIGMYPNEPPTTTLGPGTTAGSMLWLYQQIVPWYRAIVPEWPIWITPGGYAYGRPDPASGTAADRTAYLALDTNGVGLISEWHNYLFVNGTFSTDGYQSNGMHDACAAWNSNTGSKGAGSTGACLADYPDTAGSRTYLNTHFQPWADWCHNVGASGRIAPAIGEWAYDYTNKAAECARDMINAFRALGFCVEMWWNYDTAATSSNQWSARPGGTWRAAVQNWIDNTTARA